MSAVITATPSTRSTTPAQTRTFLHRPRVVVVLASGVSLGLFSAIHAHLNWRMRYNTESFRFAFGSDLARYLALAGASVVLAAMGRRVLFAAPAVAYAVTPWIAGWAMADCFPPARVLVAVGTWSRSVGAPECAPANAAGANATAIDLALVLLPAAAISFLVLRVGEGSAREERSLGARLAAFALVAFVGCCFLWIEAMGSGNGTPMRGFAATYLPAMLFGLVAGRLWVLPAVAVVTVLLTTMLPGMLAANGVWLGWQEMNGTLPIIAASSVVASWRILAHAYERLLSRPAGLLVAVNVLNVGDAVLTHFGLRTRGAVEANPVVRAIGLPVKIVAVGALSHMLFRTRPRVLGLAVLALSGVPVWHIVGIVASPA